MNIEQDQQKKQAYEAPELIIYGDIEELTRGVIIDPGNGSGVSG